MNINNIEIYKIGTGDSIYEIYKSKKLGTGTYSSVLLGKCISEKKAKEIKRIDKLVAIKKINIANLSINGAKMLTTEIEIMKEIINYSHPNIIKCYDVIDDIDVIYIVMEYCDGGDFSSLLIKKPIKYEYIKYFFQQIIKAMVFLHDNKIIHRDIKPKNILILNKEKILKLADFGFAKHLDTFKRTLTVCGSPLYMAPEIYQKVGYTESVDVWSLGIILYEMVYGKHPLNDCIDPKTLANFVMNDDIYIPENKYVDKSCLNLLKKMLKRKEADRITIEKLFRHPWIQEKCDISNIVGSIYREVDNDLSDMSSSDSENSDEDIGFLFNFDTKR